eukprot:TRINITY_DN3795_c0_g1_i2.p2 TRINITY_DN3795_c0_g1~~TRINITY_DN3795_c0_g1_i2.p2  ORF type:complete len:278 (-),score=45.92 TRINITY_DN3795_c0_g1_i2:495-1292(-)
MGISCLLSRHANISVLNLLQPEVQTMKAIMQQSDSLTCTHGKSTIKGKIDNITMNPKEVVPKADLIFFAMPSYAQEKYIQQIKPYIKPGQTIIFTPGSSNIKLLMLKHLGEKLFNDITFAAAASLSSPCRINEFGKSARMLGQKAINSIAVTPIEAAPKIIKVMDELLGVYPLNEQQQQDNNKAMIPQWKILPNYLSITLMVRNINKKTNYFIYIRILMLQFTQAFYMDIQEIGMVNRLMRRKLNFILILMKVMNRFQLIKIKKF